MKSIFIISFIVLIVFTALLLYNKKDTFIGNDNDTCVLLTTTVYINTADYKNDYNSPKSRLKIYIDSINKWLKNTNLTLYIVESSKYSFPEFKNNPRVKVCSFSSSNTIQCKECSATPYEAESILKAFNYFNLKKYNKIIKVTGKYYIPGMEKMIRDIPPDADIFFQNTNENFLQKQNSEIFGCKTMYLTEIMNTIIDNSKRNMNFESTLYTIASNYKVYRFPLIRLETPIKRSGDNKIMYDL